MPCDQYEDGLVICRPSKICTFKEDRESERWCFICRKRHEGTWRLRGEDGLSYYDPIWTYKCDGCGRDGMLGFGRERVWD